MTVFQHFFDRNPIVLKELRGRMRGGRAFAVLTLYLLLIGGALGFVFFTFFASQSGSIPVTVRQTLGRTLFGVVIGMQLLIVCFISPALTSSAVSGEREHLTFDLLRTTLLPAHALITGKLLASLSFLVLLLFTALPLQSLAFLFGGVALEEFLVASLMLVVTTLGFSALGVFFSSITRRTLISTISAYGTTILLVFGIPIFLLIGTGLMDSFLGSPTGRLGPAGEIALIVAGWLLISMNPVAAAIITEVILIEEQTLLLFEVPLSGGSSLTLASPWLSFVVLYAAATAVLIGASVRYTRRLDT